MTVRDTIRHTVSRCATALVVAIVITALVPGCVEIVPPVVVVYSTVDKQIAQPLFAEFTKATGIKVHAKFADQASDAESLPWALLVERDHPRCDLFWSDEILATLHLEREGLLRPYKSPAVSKFPTTAHSPRGTWYGIAAEARVLIINVNQIAAARRPDSIDDLTDPQWYERTAIVKPLSGTAATQAACLFTAWGDAKAQEFYRAVKRNARILVTSEEIAHTVATGQLAFGLTDSTSAIAELAAGAPVTIVYPDQADGEQGTLFVPNTASLLKGSPCPEPAEQLLDYLLSIEVSRKLADGPAAMIPLRTDVPASDRVKTPKQVRAMPADFEAAAAEWESTAKFLQEEFAAP
jgi:iron(III) transport system substrate-binding protein